VLLTALTIKEDATIPVQEQKIENKPSSRALRGMQNMQSRQVAQTASTYLSQLGSDSFVTKEPQEWTDHDVRDFLRSWLQMEDAVVALFGQLDGPAFLTLTRDQIFQMVPNNSPLYTTLSHALIGPLPSSGKPWRRCLRHRRSRGRLDQHRYEPQVQHPRGRAKLHEYKGPCSPSRRYCRSYGH